MIRSEHQFEQLLQRVSALAQGKTSEEPVDPPTRCQADADGPFFPRAPETIQHAGLTESRLEELALKYLLARGDASGRDVAEQLKLPFVMIEPILQELKQEQIITYVGQAHLNDYICRLTDAGRERARRFAQICTYYGSAPVPLADYVASVKAQTIEGQFPTPEQLREAFSDLLISQQLFAKLGPAISSGRGMFLYGYAGNGKTSIAERVTRTFTPCIWIPRAIGVEGEIIRVFDPILHNEAPLQNGGGLIKSDNIDHRWIRIRRPTIIVGGELRMEHLELTFNVETGISEAPLQLKSNCGVLVVDDFGRQRMRIDELLNRWIVPLEKRFDYLNLTSGKKIQVPFDQLVIFSTNLEPRDLVDDAFLRRIPYKIEVPNPTREEFVKLFEIMAGVLNVPYDPAAVEYLLKHHFDPTEREPRNCHPRDLLLQIRNFCQYNRTPVQMNRQSIDFAVENYFSVM